MAGKVFISCGQRPGRERDTAEKVARILEDEFDLSSYLAFKIQGLEDIMTITKELRSSDYYLFIDFQRKTKSKFHANPFPPVQRKKPVLVSGQMTQDRVRYKKGPSFDGPFTVRSFF